MSKAKRDPVWKNGRIVANNGGIDLLDGAVDMVFIQKGRRVLFAQITYVGNESPRRRKLREAGFDPAYHEAILMAFDPSERSGTFRVFRLEDDFLEKGYRLNPGDTVFPWEATTQQLAL